MLLHDYICVCLLSRPDEATAGLWSQEIFLDHMYFLKFDGMERFFNPLQSGSNREFLAEFV